MYVEHVRMNTVIDVERVTWRRRHRVGRVGLGKAWRLIESGARQGCLLCTRGRRRTRHRSQDGRADLCIAIVKLREDQLERPCQRAQHREQRSCATHEAWKNAFRVSEWHDGTDLSGSKRSAHERGNHIIDEQAGRRLAS